MIEVKDYLQGKMQYLRTNCAFMHTGNWYILSLLLTSLALTIVDPLSISGFFLIYNKC